MRRISYFLAAVAAYADNRLVLKRVWATGFVHAHLNDLLCIPVLRPTMVETTALGAAYLAGLTSGVYKSKEQLSSLWQVERRFTPSLPRVDAQALMEQWEHAVRQACLPKV